MQVQSQRPVVKPKFLVKLHSKREEVLRSLAQKQLHASMRPGAVDRSTVSAAVTVASQIEARVRLRAFEEHGSDEARLNEPEDLEDSKLLTALHDNANTPFLDLYFGRKFKLPVETLVSPAKALDNKKSFKLSGKGLAGKGVIRGDYYLLRLFLRAIIADPRVDLPQFYYDSKNSAAGHKLITLLSISDALESWKNLSVEKNTRGFTVELPVCRIPASVLLSSIDDFLNYGEKSSRNIVLPTKISGANPDGTGTLKLSIEPGVPADFPVARIQADRGIPAAELQYLAKAGGTIRVYNQGSASGQNTAETTDEVLAVTLRLQCSREEAQYLLQQNHAQARAIDLYNVLLNHVMPRSRQGNSHAYDGSRNPAFGVSLQRMARALPKDAHELKRTNDDGIAVGDDGDLIHLPASLNNVDFYDESWNSVLDPEMTGRIGLTNPATEPAVAVNMSADEWAKKKVSKLGNLGSMPVLCDWQNCKFAYTDTTGRLNVMDLDKVYTARLMHYMRFLRTSIASKTLAQAFLSDIHTYLDLVGINSENLGFPSDAAKYLSMLANSLGYFTNETFSNLPLLAIPYTASPYYEPDTSEEFERLHGIYDPLKVAVEQENGESVEVSKKAANKQAIPDSVGIMNCAAELLRLIEEQPERFYRSRSVVSVMRMRAKLKIFLRARDLPELMRLEAAESSVYRNQKLDPDYRTEPLPLISTERDGIKPQYHQENCLNLMRDNPDHAILPVSAGGGKCLDYNHVVTTSRGLLSVGEIYESSGDYIGNTGFRELSGTKVVTSAGILPADRSYSTVGKTIKVSFSDGSYIEGLPEHRLWATTDGIRFDYVRLDALTSAHSLEKRVGLGVFGKQTKLPALVTLSTDSAAFKNSANNISIPRTITESLACLLGYIVSEGSVKNYAGRDVVNVFNTDEEVIQKIELSAIEVFGPDSYSKIEEKPRSIKHRPVTKIQFKSSAARFIVQLVGVSNSASIGIPACIRMAPRAIQVAFLRALFEGDGSVYVKSHGKNDKGYDNSWVVDYTTISSKLALHLRAMLENLGVLCTVRHRRPYKSIQCSVSGEPETKQAHTIIINYRSFSAFKQIGFDCTRKSALFKSACEAADQAASNVINKNSASQGTFNKFFFSGSLATISQVVHAIVSSKEFVTRIRNSGCTKLQYVQNAFTELGLSNDSYRGFFHSEYSDKLSRHAVDQIHKFIEPNLHLVGTKLQSTYNKLRDSLTKNWIQPIASQRSNVAKRVYDISVPGPHDYVVDSLLSHNTVLAILDVLRQIDRGEKGPFIIACPANLVPDYVAELSFATAGKINPIPITTEVWNLHSRTLKDSLRSIVKTAPVNTVLIVSYRVLSLGSYDVCYGSDIITVYPVIQFLRSFRPTYAFFDECHSLKTPDAAQHQAALKLMSGIKKKRLASGTMVANTLTDLVGQIKLLDPTLFGSLEDFTTEYTETVEGSKKRKPRAGAETAVKNILFSNMVIAGADRKQWAYKLPKQERNFIRVQLTPLQQVTHDYLLSVIFNMSGSGEPSSGDDYGSSEGDNAGEAADNRLAQSISEGRVRAQDLLSSGKAEKYNSSKSIPAKAIREDGTIDIEALLQDARNIKSANTSVTEESEGEEEDEKKSADEQAKEESKGLSNYLVLVETFISTPGDFEGLMAYLSDRYGVPFLDIDLLSPKVATCIEVIKHHLKATPEGKFIVFCNYNKTRESLVAHLPPEIKNISINYLAAQKLTQRKEFMENENIRGLIGIEKSLSTGFNLQVGTRLIRLETVWTPADIEQGNSRINRPNIKAGESRSKIYYDTIVADNTLDVAKVASLVSKQITQIKFDQTEAVPLEDNSAKVKQRSNPFFGLVVPDPFSLSPMGIIENSNIHEMNDKYLRPLEHISTMLENVYAQFAIDNKEKLFHNPDIIKVDTKVPSNTVFPKELIKKEYAIQEKAPPKGAFLMHRIPYAVGMELYKADALGLVPYRKWLEEMGFAQYIEKLGITPSYRPDASVLFGTPEYDEGLKAHAKALADAEHDFVMRKSPPRVHTDTGDGVVVKVNKSNITVRFGDGTKRGILRNMLFVITRTYTNTNDIRRALISNSKLPIKDANMKDLKPIPLEELVVGNKTNNKPLPAPTPSVVRQPAVAPQKPAVQQIKDSMIDITVTSINGYPTIQVDTEILRVRPEDNKLGVVHKPSWAGLKDNGFAPSPKTLYILRLKSGADLARVIALIEKNGYFIPNVVRSRLLDLRDYVAGAQGLVKKLDRMHMPPLDDAMINLLHRQITSKTADGAEKAVLYPYIVGGNSFQVAIPRSPVANEILTLIRESSMASRVKIVTRPTTRLLRILSDKEEAQEVLDAMRADDLISDDALAQAQRSLEEIKTVAHTAKLMDNYKPVMDEVPVAEEQEPATKPTKVEKPAAEQQPVKTEQKPTAPASPQGGKESVEVEIASYDRFYAIEIAATSAEMAADLKELGFKRSSLRAVQLSKAKELAEACKAIVRDENYRLAPENKKNIVTILQEWYAHPNPDDLLNVASKMHSASLVRKELRLMQDGGDNADAGDKTPVFLVPIVTQDSVLIGAPSGDPDSLEAFEKHVVPNVSKKKIIINNKNKFVLLADSIPSLSEGLRAVLGKYAMSNKADVVAKFAELRDGKK